MFIAQVLVGLSKQLKQIIQTEHNIVKSLNWLEGNQLASYKHDWGFEFRATKKQIQVVVRVGLEPASNMLTTWRRSLLNAWVIWNIWIETVLNVIIVMFYA